MAKGKNKKTYRPIKNANMIGKGEKKTVSQIVADGSKAKPKELSNVKFENQKKAEAAKANRPNIDAKVQEAKKEQSLAKNSEKQKPKEKEHDRDR